MCGIFAYLSNSTISEELQQKLIKEGFKSKHRGPDNTNYRLERENIFLMFHRLRVNDLTDKGDQPFTHPEDYNIILICNGEIYNHKVLEKKYDFDMVSTSDCEVILHLYKKFGFKKTISMLDGVFACVVIDLRDQQQKIFAARDRIGVRSMYMGHNDNQDYGFSSEMKSLQNVCDHIEQFKPGHIWSSETNSFTKYWDIYSEFNKSTLIESDESQIQLEIRQQLTKAVQKRMMSDRQIGCLLSGGLDSSLIAGILSREYKEGTLHTYSVGLEGATDLKYARIVADHLKTEHHELIVTENMMIDALKKVIYQLETWDITTIRASTPMVLLSQFIFKTSKDAVIFSGEGSDEASGSYLYFHNAPNVEAFKMETIRLLSDLCYYDCKRCDEATAGAGLEVRVPFLDIEFLDYYMNIDSQLKMPTEKRAEKHLLRSSFTGMDLIPDEVLWRTKEAMSDGVSSVKRGWFEIIQDHANAKYTDSEFQTLQKKYTWHPPQTKEALYFREIFNEFYPNRCETIPYTWLPKWSGDIVDPSARVLDVYDHQNKKTNENDNILPPASKTI